MSLSSAHALSSIASGSCRTGSLQSSHSPNPQPELPSSQSAIPLDLSHSAGMDRISRAVALNESFHLSWLEAQAPLAASNPAALDINQLTQSTNALHRLTSIRKTLIFLEDTLAARANRPAAPVTDHQALDYAETLLTRMAASDPAFARALISCHVNLAHEFSILRARHAVPDALATQARVVANELAHKLARDHIAHGDAFYRAAQTMLDHADLPSDRPAGILPASDRPTINAPSTPSTPSTSPSPGSALRAPRSSQSTIPMAPDCPTLTLDQLNQAIASLDANIALLTGLPLSDSTPTTHNTQPTTLASTPSTSSLGSIPSIPQSEISNLKSEITCNHAPAPHSEIRNPQFSSPPP